MELSLMVKATFEKRRKMEEKQRDKGKMKTIGSSQQSQEKSRNKDNRLWLCWRGQSCCWSAGTGQSLSGTAQLSQKTPQIQFIGWHTCTSIRCAPELHQSSLVSNCWNYTGAMEAQLWPRPHCCHKPAASLVQETLSFCLRSEAIKVLWKTQVHLFMLLLVYF